MRSGKAVDILLVEDNAGDIRLTIETLKDCKINSTLHITRDGEEALDFLYRRGQHARAIRPDLILLDLNLPRKDGREVLKEIKEDPDLRRIPVTVLTVSGAEADILKSYNLHCNCYIQKSMDLDQFSRAVRSIEDFWSTIVTLPPNALK